MITRHISEYFSIRLWFIPSIALIVLLFSACTKTDNVMPMPQVVRNCAGPAEVNPFDLECDALSFLPEMYCEPEFLGNFTLADESLDFMQQYCRPIGDALSYSSPEGNVIELIVTEKAYQERHSVHTSQVYCDVLKTKRYSYCLYGDEMSVTLTSRDNSIKLRIILSLTTDYRADVNVGVGDGLRVLRQNASSLYFVEMDAVVNQGSLSYSEGYSQYYYDALELNDELYSEVYSNKQPGIPSNLLSGLYINKDYGLFAFEDESGVVYTLQP